MKALFAVLLLSLGLVGPAIAADEIIIYKGTSTHKHQFNAVDNQPATAGVYAIADYTAKKFAQLIFYSRNNKKFYMVLNDVPLPQSLTVTQVDGTTATIMVLPLDIDSDANNFAYGSSYLRGKNENVVLRKLPSQLSTLRPRTITFLYRAAGKAQANPFFIEDTVRATILAGVTISTNNGGSTDLTDAKNAIADKLEGQGYVLEN